VPSRSQIFLFLFSSPISGRTPDNTRRQPLARIPASLPRPGFCSLPPWATCALTPCFLFATGPNRGAGGFRPLSAAPRLLRRCGAQSPPPPSRLSRLAFPPLNKFREELFCPEGDSFPNRRRLMLQPTAPPLPQFWLAFSPATPAAFSSLAVHLLSPLTSPVRFYHKTLFPYKRSLPFLSASPLQLRSIFHSLVAAIFRFPPFAR